MATWTCPDCKRTFGAVGRNHMCNPGLTIEEFLADAPSFVAPVFHVVHDHLTSVDADVDGDLIVDPLDGKVLFKNGPTFCIIDVKTKWVAVGFSLRRAVESGRLSRKTSEQGGRYYHVVNVDDPVAVDSEFCDWLTEAYHHGSQGRGSQGRGSQGRGSQGKGADAGAGGFDPMVPDDIDFEIAPPR